MAPFLGASSVNTQPLRTDYARPEADDQPRRRVSTGLGNLPSKRRQQSSSSSAVSTACLLCSILTVAPTCPGCGVSARPWWPLLLPGACGLTKPSEQILHSCPLPNFQPLFQAHLLCKARLAQLPTPLHSPSQLHTRVFLWYLSPFNMLCNYYYHYYYVAVFCFFVVVIICPPHQNVSPIRAVLFTAVFPEPSTVLDTCACLILIHSMNE